MGGDLVTAMKIIRDARFFDADDPESFSSTALHYFDLGDVAAAESWNDAALRIDSESPHPKVMAAHLQLYREEDAEAVAIAREFARPDSHNRFASRGIALRILAASDLAAAKYDDIIARYLTHYPELAVGTFPNEQLQVDSMIWEAFLEGV